MKKLLSMLIIMILLVGLVGCIGGEENIVVEIHNIDYSMFIGNWIGTDVTQQMGTHIELNITSIENNEISFDIWSRRTWFEKNNVPIIDNRATIDYFVVRGEWYQDFEIFFEDDENEFIETLEIIFDENEIVINWLGTTFRMVRDFSRFIGMWRDDGSGNGGWLNFYIADITENSITFDINAHPTVDVFATSSIVNNQFEYFYNENHYLGRLYDNVIYLEITRPDGWVTISRLIRFGDEANNVPLFDYSSFIGTWGYDLDSHWNWSVLTIESVNGNNISFSRQWEGDAPQRTSGVIIDNQVRWTEFESSYVMTFHDYSISIMWEQGSQTRWYTNHDITP